MRAIWIRQVIFALLLLFAVVLAGGAALYLLADSHLSYAEAVYFTLITVSTVGYGEPEGLADIAGARVVTSTLIVLGVAAMAFFNSTLTAILVEGHLAKIFRDRRMKNRLESLHGHFVVAGCGRTGRFCAQELFALGRPFAVIDSNAAMLERLNEEQFGGKLRWVAGDATDDHALKAAGVERARGLVAALPLDKDNVFVVLSGRTLNPEMEIVAKALDVENETKLRKAGANKLVSPHRIGGVRLVSELVRPRTMEFLDELQAMSGSDLHMEDVELQAGSPLEGVTLRDAPIRKEQNALVVAIRESNGRFIHSPGADHQLRAGSHLIVVGDADGVTHLRRLATTD